jgi:hypothetical protein
MSEYEAIVDQYHQCIRDHTFNILSLDFPKLRQPRHISHGVIEACADAKCRICAPHSTSTLEKIRYYVTTMYFLMTGNRACNADYTPNDHTDHFLANEWFLDYDRAVEVSSTVLRDGNSVGALERMARLRSLAQMCDAVHTEEYLAMATRYRAKVDCIDKERKTVKRPAAETKDEASEDLTRIRTALTTYWEANRDTLISDPQQMDDLLYCAVVFGMEVDDVFAPIRTDWWRASYKPDVLVPGINKPCNHIEITDTDVWLCVPSCSKEPQNSVDAHVNKDSPLLATILRLYYDTAMDKNNGLLFRPCSLTARNSRRPRAMIKLLRPPGECPHQNQCTRCHETFVCGTNGRRECACTRAGKRARPECGAYCGSGCGHYTNIMGRHKRVCAELGNVDERAALASSMGTSLLQVQRYGSGSGSVA